MPRRHRGKGPERVYVQAVDEATGELGLVPVYMGKALAWKEKYLLLFQARAEQFACDRALTGEQLKVFLFLVARCDWENWVRLRYKDMAEAMGLHFSQVGRAMRYWIKRGVLIRGPQRYGSCYRLSSQYAFKGKLTDLQAYRQREARRSH